MGEIRYRHVYRSLKIKLKDEYLMASYISEGEILCILEGDM